MRVVIANAQVPFVRGGAEMLAESLFGALLEAGHEVDIVSIPFKWYPPERIIEQVLANRLFSLDSGSGNRIDRMIGLKFPAYLMPHPEKVMWLLHQHRAAYDNWDSEIADIIQWPGGRAVREAVAEADGRAMRECRFIYTISGIVSRRLRDFNGVESTPLYHPPPAADTFRHGEQGDYVLVPSRVDPTKRQNLVLEALARTRRPVRAIFVGAGNAPDYERKLRAAAEASGLGDRVQWRGAVTHAEKIDLYAGALGIVFVPIGEDYGYVTLEAMLSGKPVVTCSDSGGPLEFIRDGENGLVRPADPKELADALDLLWAERSLARRLGIQAFEDYRSRDLRWSDVVSRLLA